MNPTTGLLNVFAQYSGNVLFQRLVSGSSASGSILGKVGWLFTAAGALLILWGHIARTSRAQPGERVTELGRTGLIFGALLAGPFLMRAAMEGADDVYQSAIGGSGTLTMACVKAAYAMPELNHLFDRVGSPPAQQTATLSKSDDSTPTGYLASFFLSMWDTAANYVATVRGSIQETMRIAAVLSGLGAATAKVALAATMLIPVYLLFLLSGAIIWFMAQVRFFLAVIGTLMLPPFIGMLSLPADHPNRAPAHRYLMNLVSLAMWPIAWTVGHAGTIVLFDALAGLIADGSRTPALQSLLSWNSLSSGATVTELQLQAGEAALGNWFMGGVAPELATVVGAAGFALWVFLVAVAGPVLLHRVFSAGSLYATQALQMTGRTGLRVASAASIMGPSVMKAFSTSAPVSGGGGAKERSFWHLPEALLGQDEKGAPERSLGDSLRRLMREGGPLS